MKVLRTRIYWVINRFILFFFYRLLLISGRTMGGPGKEKNWVEERRDRMELSHHVRSITLGGRCCAGRPSEGITTIYRLLLTSRRNTMKIVRAYSSHSNYSFWVLLGPNGSQTPCGYFFPPYPPRSD